MAGNSMQMDCSSMMVQQGSLMSPSPSLPPSGPGSRRAGASLSTLQHGASLQQVRHSAAFNGCY